MSKNKAKTKAENRAKRLLIAIVSAFIAIALGATCALWFGNSAKPVSVNGATGDVTASANRGPLTGNQSGWNSSGVPLIAEGDMIYIERGQMEARGLGRARRRRLSKRCV